MKLKLLNIDEYIVKNNLKEITTASIFSPGGVGFDPKGLWSEDIFGRAGSNNRRSKFGFINLKVKIINPPIYPILLTSCPEMRRIILSKEKYIIENKKLIQDNIGETGIQFLISNIDKLDLTQLIKKKDSVRHFIEKNLKSLFINKYLIMPAGVRDLSSSRPASKQFTSEINDMYERLISLNNQLEFMNDSESLELFTTYIQKVCLQIYKWLQTNIKGKGGIYRGTMLKKTLDYSARIIATSSPNIQLGSIGLPWHTLLILFEPYFFHWVFKKDPILRQEIQQYLGTDSLSYENMKTFNLKISKDPDNIPSRLKDLLFKATEEICVSKQILCKRDPVVDRASYYSGNIVPLKEGKAAVVNSLSVTPQGLDFDGDQLAFMPTFTKEATKEAERMNPSKSKTAWINPLTTENIHYGLKLDAISTIYAATLT